MLKRVIAVVLVVFLVIFAGTLAVHMNWSQRWNESSLANDHEIVVLRGASTNQVLMQLSQLGLIPDSRWYRKWRTILGLQQAKAGEYVFPAGSTTAQIWSMLANGEVKQYSVTLVEGTNVYDVLAQLRGLDFLEYDIESTTPQALADELGFRVSSAEGRFAAETFYVTRGTKASDLLLDANRELQSWLDELDIAALEELPLNTLDEVLILASIVEKETAVVSERPVIASVFIQRLRLGMRLQTDPTVIYGLLPDFNGNITRRDLRAHTPWNTYVIRGLPPTPIALVSRDALRAVMVHEPTEYLYFVAKGDGSHYFSQTLEEHNRAVRRYQLGQDN
jgi:UPF0755 protein